MTGGPNQHFHTTIKVTSDLRDKLKAQAEENGWTMGEQLAFLIEMSESAARMEAMKAAIDATPPELMQSYREEVEFWDSVGG